MNHLAAMMDEMGLRDATTVDFQILAMDLMMQLAAMMPDILIVVNMMDFGIVTAVDRQMVMAD